MHTALLVVYAVLLTLVPAGVIAALKGRWALILAGICLVLPAVWYGAIALAAPDSWWARRFYRGEKLERARVFHDKWARRFAE